MTVAASHRSAMSAAQASACGPPPDHPMVTKWSWPRESRTSRGIGGDVGDRPTGPARSSPRSRGATRGRGARPAPLRSARPGRRERPRRGCRDGTRGGPIGRARREHLQGAAVVQHQGLDLGRSRSVGAVAHASVPGRPLEQFRHRPGVDDALGEHLGVGRLLAAVAEPLELPRRVGVGVDRHQAPRRHRHAQEGVGGIEAFGSGVDLDGGAGADAGVEHLGVVEARFGSAPADDDASRAVTEDVGMGALDGGDHAPGHRRRVHLELGVHAGHHDVEPAQQVGILVEGTVLQDVDLDAGEDPKRRQLGVQRLDHFELTHQALGVEAVGDGEPRAVVGERQVLVTELGGGLGHLVDGAPAVGPVGMAVAVPPQQGPELGGAPRQGGRRLRLEVQEVGRASRPPWPRRSPGPWCRPRRGGR